MKEEYSKAIKGSKTFEEMKMISTQYHSECKVVLNKIITFLGNHIKEEQWYKDYVQECWKDVELECETFESWFDDDCILKSLNQDGVQDCLGHLYYKYGADEFNNMLDKWGFDEWVDTIIGDKTYRMDYVKERAWVYVDPKVKVFVS